MSRAGRSLAAFFTIAVILWAISTDPPQPVGKQAVEAKAEPITKIAGIVKTAAVEPPAQAPKREGTGLLAPSGLGAQDLEAGLVGDLKPYAWCFVEAERETGVNAVFLASVAALESGWNTSEVAQGKNNLFGWTSGSGYQQFESKEACILYVAGKIKANYLSPDGCYFRGYTVEAVNEHYNGAPEWASQITQIMLEIQERSGNNGK